ncbi:MAG: hypothetical protein LBD30_06710 [Verrucomicrobiales bacterium]|nr:hypothetical protein [Verrucomicrobiales bacterium]
MQAIPDEDLTVLEFAAGQQPRPAEFSQKLKHLLSNWSTQTTLARRLMEAARPKHIATDYAAPEWFAWSASLAHLQKNLPDFRNLTDGERTMCGLSFDSLPETEQAKFWASLTPEQTQFLTQAKEDYERWKIHNRTNRHPQTAGDIGDAGRDVAGDNRNGLRPNGAAYNGRQPHHFADGERHPASLEPHRRLQTA